jgi:hypothetical protein
LQREEHGFVCGAERLAGLCAMAAALGVAPFRLVNDRFALEVCDLQDRRIEGRNRLRTLNDGRLAELWRTLARRRVSLNAPPVDARSLMWVNAALNFQPVNFPDARIPRDHAELDGDLTCA